MEIQMSRSLVAIVVLSLMVGLTGMATADPAAKSGSAPIAFSIDMRAPIAEVIQAVITSSGANIVTVGEVSGAVSVSLREATVEKVLTTICKAKGLYWWQEEDGTYCVSSQPRPAGDGEQATKVAALPAAQSAPVMKQHMQKLQFIDPQTVVYQLGLSDDPGPEMQVRDPGFTTQLHAVSVTELGGGMGGGGGGGGGRGGGTSGGSMGGGSRGGTTGGTGGRAGGTTGGLGGGGQVGGAGNRGAGGGDLRAFLPDGIEDIVAFPMLNSLLIRGTEEGIDAFINFLKLIDKKPQQILIEIQSIIVSSVDIREFGINWFYNTGAWTFTPNGFGTSGSTITVGYAPSANFQASLQYLLTSTNGKITDAIRVATMNLVTASNVVTTQYPIVTTSSTTSGAVNTTTSTAVSVTMYPITTSLVITPRINGDGTITMYIPYTKSAIAAFIEVPNGNGATLKYPETTTNSIATLLNVRDGETFVLGGFVSNQEDYGSTKLPLLGDLPLIGKLFTKTSRNVSQNETLIFITPRIIKDEAAPASLGPI
jgi:type II secretory pathway component GspD/PulD (secretin)